VVRRSQKGLLQPEQGKAVLSSKGAWDENNKEAGSGGGAIGEESEKTQAADERSLETPRRDSAPTKEWETGFTRLLKEGGGGLIGGVQSGLKEGHLSSAGSAARG